MTCSNRMRLSQKIAVDFSWCIWVKSFRTNGRYMSRHMRKWFCCSATCCKTNEKLLENAWMESSIPPILFIRHTPFRLLFIPLDGINTSIIMKLPKKWVDFWIASKDIYFFWNGIHMLPERWEKVGCSDGQYFVLNDFLPCTLNRVFILSKQQWKLI